jgi:hypothetical protein
MVCAESLGLSAPQRIARFLSVVFVNQAIDALGHRLRGSASSHESIGRPNKRRAFGTQAGCAGLRKTPGSRASSAVAAHKRSGIGKRTPACALRHRSKRRSTFGVWWGISGISLAIVSPSSPTRGKRRTNQLRSGEVMQGCRSLTVQRPGPRRGILRADDFHGGDTSWYSPAFFGL